MTNTVTPKYHRLAELIRQQITNGDLAPGDQLPTEDALRQTYQVSRGTVREAVRVLIDEGLIRREQGRGTFVNQPQPASTLFTLTSFDDEMRRQNRFSTTRVLATEIVPAGPELAGRLALPAGEPVIHIARLRLADNQPIVFETRHLAQSLCPNLLNENLTTDSIHGLLVRKYNIPLVKMTHTVEIRQLTAGQAQQLQSQSGRSAFFVDRLTFTIKDGAQIPAVWYQAIHREDSYHISASSRRSL
jgi:GntR family transcriptional regulator